MVRICFFQKEEIGISLAPMHSFQWIRWQKKLSILVQRTKITVVAVGFFPCFSAILLEGQAAETSKQPSAPLHSSRATRAPLETKKIIQSLPNQKLSLDTVLSLGKKSSTAFKDILETENLVSSLSLQSLAAFDTRLLTGAQFQHDEREALSPPNPFSQKSNQSWGTSLGVQKYWATGTETQFEIGPKKIETQFSNPATPAFNAYETGWNVGINQNLWKDAFGVGTRYQTQILNNEADLSKLQMADAKESWALQISQIYYSAWLGQQEILAHELALENKNKLLKILKLKMKRGTAEKPDFLQAETAVLATENQLEISKQRLHELWLSLRVQLGLPDTFDQIDLKEIPLSLDSDPLFENLENKCSEANHPNRAELIARGTLENAELKEKETASMTSPDLKLKASLFGNGVDSSLSKSSEEFIKGDHLGYTVGVQLSFSLDRSLEKASLLQATAAIERARIKNQAVLDQNQIDRNTICHALIRTKQSLRLAQETAEKQRDRARLEENRFELGRSGVFQVIQADDDAVRAQVGVAAARVEYQLALWKFARLLNLISSKIERL